MDLGWSLRVRIRPFSVGYDSFQVGEEFGFDADIHGFRTSFRTWAQERTNFPREVTEAALAQLSGDAVVRAYVRSDLFESWQKMRGAGGLLGHGVCQGGEDR